MKLRFFHIGLLALMLAGCGRQRLQQLTSDADDANQRHDYEHAIADYTEVIRIAPQFEPAYTARAGDYVVLGKYDLALDDLKLALQLNPTNFLAYQLRGGAFYGRREYDKAIGDFDLSLEYQADNTNGVNGFEIKGESFKLRGMASYRLGLVTNAIADLNEAEKYLPGDYVIYEIRGYCYDSRVNADKCLKDFNKAIELNPADVTALYGRAGVYSQTGSCMDAIQDFEKVIRLRPQAVGAYNLLAWLLATCPDDALRDGKRAVELATRACDMSQWTNYAYVDTLAAAYAETGDFDSAVKYQKQAAGMTDVPADNRTNVQNRIELYLKHEPYRKSKTFKEYD